MNITPCPMNTLSSMHYAFADKTVAGNLASASNSGILLDLDKGADLCLVSDFAAVEIDELRKPHILAQS